MGHSYKSKLYLAVIEKNRISGEAEPNEFTAEHVSENVTVFESHNVAFTGSFCVEGEGFGIVINVADDTVNKMFTFLLETQLIFN